METLIFAMGLLGVLALECGSALIHHPQPINYGGDVPAPVLEKNMRITEFLCRMSLRFAGVTKNDGEPLHPLPKSRQETGERIAQIRRRKLTKPRQPCC